MMKNTCLSFVFLRFFASPERVYGCLPLIALYNYDGDLRRSTEPGKEYQDWLESPENQDTLLIGKKIVKLYILKHSVNKT